MDDNSIMMKNSTSAAVAIPAMDGNPLVREDDLHGAVRPSDILISSINSVSECTNRKNSFFRKISSIPGMIEYKCYS